MEVAIKNQGTQKVSLAVIAAFPEGLTQIEFKHLYGNVEDPEYRALVQQIDNAINKLPAYSGK